MPQVQLEREEDILLRLVARVVAETDLTDILPTSRLYHILGAVARAVGDSNYQISLMSRAFSLKTAQGDDLDERARDIVDIERLGALRATGQAVFSRASSTAGTTTIPSGTIIINLNGITYRTTAATTITNASAEQISGHGVGRDSTPATFEAVTAGANGDSAAATITRFQSKPAGVNEVINTSAAAGGRDRESDDLFVARIQAYIAGLGSATVDTLESRSLGVTSGTKTVVYSKVVQRPTETGLVRLYIDDGAGTAESTVAVASETVIASAVGGEEYLYLDNKPVRIESTHTITSSTRGALTEDTDYFLNPATGLLFFSPALVAAESITAVYTYFDGLIAEVQRVMDGVESDRANYPGYVAAGVVCRVLAPEVVNVVVGGSLVIDDTYTRADVILEAEAAVADYINNLGISAAVIRNELIERIMLVPGVKDLVLDYPTENIETQDDQIPRISTADIELE